ncbi:glutamate formimidoyltransferase [Companilactobacillus suantsaicola]|uniref:glutamate formimidoyltransferase n=1 Tax=Companilactobacillus suantsaicola TaxID=2487723 RepID=A0A4Z0JG77_9LACO|nr:glutamate formimidoyltransferase [Companilactobacillus suantsaicola]TGD21759.1 glutamate formimidoyltransferase [Companilactobacillus suantsaicola]
MAKLIECIPNFSEGQNQETIDGLVKVAKSVPGVNLFDYSSDKSHNRSVFTLVGDEDGIQEVAFQLVKYASEHIDMTKHHGEHPRMGATDVVPFVPIKDVTVEECVEISKKVAKRINDELNIPIFLYEESASNPMRKNLAKVRKGQFEGMPEKLQEKDWAPDYGERKIHPTAGVTAVGARMPLVAFNVNLDTSDLSIAKKIAKVLRGSSGGYKYCKAIGVMLEDRNIAQVSMNMVNYEGTPLYRTFETIKFEAKRYGVNIIGSEVIGLTPAKALVDCAEYYLQIEDFDYQKQVLENHLLG